METECDAVQDIKTHIDKENLNYLMVLVSNIYRLSNLKAQNAKVLLIKGIYFFTRIQRRDNQRNENRRYGNKMNEISHDDD